MEDGPRPSCNFWNYLELSPPVILSSNLKCENAHNYVSQMKIITNEITKTLKDLNLLNVEAATLSRLLYRTKYVLRQEKSFKALQMINRCLTNYNTMHLPFTLTSLGDMLHGTKGPSRQMLEWALVRLCGAANLFHRVYSLCVNAAGHLFVRIKLGHLWDINYLLIANISRIWTFSQFIVRKTCEWYRSLYQFLDILEASPVPWLPKECVLPQDLSRVLGYPKYLKNKALNKPSKLLSHVNVNINKDDLLANNKDAFMHIKMMDDVGESITREFVKENICDKNLPESDEINLKRSKKREKGKLKQLEEKLSSKLYNHDIDSIKSADDLETFIKTEIAFKNGDFKNKKFNITPIIKTVDKSKWESIKEYFYKQINLLKKCEKSGNVKIVKKLLRKIRINIKRITS